MEKRVIKEIQNLTKLIKKENQLKEDIIREDVFNILLNNPNCMVLFYPIASEANEDGCDGCHVVRTVNGKEKQLVFINSSNTMERQAFSVAHELGHIWNVDGRLRENLPDVEIVVEDVINRFAAELLMPERLFIDETNDYIKLLLAEETENNGIRVISFLKLIVHLMNYFFAPYKAVVIRLFEVGIIDEDVQMRLMEYKDSDYVKSIINEGQYSRLGYPTNKKSIPNLADKIEEIEKRELFTPNRIRAIKEKFELVEERDDVNMDDIVILKNQKGSGVE